MEYIGKMPSPVGELTLSSDGQSLTGLWLEGQKYFGATLAEDTHEEELPVFAQTRAWLERYFAGEAPPLDLPLAPQGSAFRRAVWDILCRIPSGQLMTYGDIARQLNAGSPGKKTSARAVGGAVGHNPISIIIPCHRVVGADGSLTGYAGGVERKLQLLRLEKALV